MSEHPPAGEHHRVEDHLVFALLAIPIFIVSAFIIALIATLGGRGL
jgi:hypothetical protein